MPLLRLPHPSPIPFVRHSGSCQRVVLPEKQRNFGFGKVFPALSLPEPMPMPTHVRMKHGLLTAKLTHRAVTSNFLHAALLPWLPCALRQIHYDYNDKTTFGIGQRYWLPDASNVTQDP
jgi:hypothetical protein